MPIVKVELWPGRSRETKGKIAKEITRVLVENLGCSAQAVTVQFSEISKDHWAIGGELCSDLFSDVK